MKKFRTVVTAHHISQLSAVPHFSNTRISLLPVIDVYLYG